MMHGNMNLKFVYLYFLESWRKTIETLVMKVDASAEIRTDHFTNKDQNSCGLSQLAVSSLV
jgi:hypothetical protein